MSDNSDKKYNIEESRWFANKSYLDSINSEQRKGKSNFYFGAEAISFCFDDEWLIYSKKHKSAYINPENYILNGNDTIGSITDKNNTNLTLIVEYISEKKPKEINFFGIHSKASYLSVNENFVSDSLSMENLNYITRHYKCLIFDKNKSYTFELIQNFQVLDRTFLTEKKFKAIKQTFKTKKNQSDFTTEYWSNERLFDLPSSVVNLLNDKLIMIQ